MTSMLDLLRSHTFQTVALGTAVLGAVSGALGSFAVLRRQSLLGDAISHAALPGIAIAFLITGSKTPLVLMVGAAAAGILGTIIVMCVVNATRVKDDAALGIVLSVFFGFGLMLLSYLQNHPDAAQAGLNNFLFGQAAAMLNSDVRVLSIIAAIVILAVVLFWKEFKLLAFDRDFAASLGFPVRMLDVILTSLLTVAIVLGLQTVGVVLMSALVVAPAAAARQWTNRLGVMVLLAAMMGAFSGVAGATLSTFVAKVPTGPAVVLCVSVIVLLSLTLAPKRGLVWAYLTTRRNRRRLRLIAVLTDLFALEKQHEPGLPHGHSPEAIHAMSMGEGGVKASLEQLGELGLAYELASGRWALTEEGLDKARRVLSATGTAELKI